MAITLTWICHWVFSDRISISITRGSASKLGNSYPICNFLSSQLSACFPLMALAQNMQLVGKGQEIAQNSQMILGVWGWQSGRKARTRLLEPDGLGSDPSSVPHQLHDFGWAPETHWVSVSSSAEFLYLSFSGLLWPSILNKYILLYPF